MEPPRSPDEGTGSRGMRQRDAMIKVRVSQGPGKPRVWLMFLAVCDGVHCVSGETRAVFTADDIDLKVIVPSKHVLEPPPNAEGGRVPAGWQTDLLKRKPVGCEEMGLNVAVQLLPKDYKAGIAAWSGWDVETGKPPPLGVTTH